VPAIANMRRRIHAMANMPVHAVNRQRRNVKGAAS